MSHKEESHPHWTYDEPAGWCNHYPDAKGSAQSPINIISRNTVAQSFTPFVFSSRFNSTKLFILTNNGRHVAATLSDRTYGQNNKDLWFSGGGLTGRYYFVNFHVHWGPDDTCGGEHEIDGQQFPAEAHFVFKNDQTGQLAVLGVLFTMNDSPYNVNNEWEKYADASNQLVKSGETMECSFNLRKLIQIDEGHFFRYAGSLTTPPCTEGVVWTLFTSVVPIKVESLGGLRQNLYQKIYRPVQPINDRPIYRSYQK